MTHNLFIPLKSNLKELEELNKLILDQNYINNVAKNTWILFRNHIINYDRIKIQLIKRGLKHLLLDFYLKSFAITKNLKKIFDEYDIKPILVGQLIKEKINKLITKQLAIDLHEVISLK